MRKVDQAAEKANSTVETYKGDFNFAFRAGVSFANSKDNEWILCAAIEIKTIDRNQIVLLYRELGETYIGKKGFLTSKGRFVDRKEAGKIAYEIGQIDKEVDELTSEMLY